jgi:hypothetical protein
VHWTVLSIPYLIYQHINVHERKENQLVLKTCILNEFTKSGAQLRDSGAAAPGGGVHRAAKYIF